jgi:hypothetical protein
MPPHTWSAQGQTWYDAAITDVRPYHRGKTSSIVIKTDESTEISVEPAPAGRSVEPGMRISIGLVHNVGMKVVVDGVVILDRTDRSWIEILTGGAR